MAPINKASLLLITAAVARLASASTVLAFPDSSCDQTGYYESISADSATCSVNYLSGKLCSL